MSIFTDTELNNLSKETAYASKVTLYGLHYNVSWDNLFQKRLILKALLINESIDIYTDEQLSCLHDRIMAIGCGCSNCT